MNQTTFQITSVTLIMLSNSFKLSRSASQLTSTRNVIAARKIVADGQTEDAFEAQDNRYCLEDVKESDRDMYLCILHSPKEHHKQLFAARAFGVELGRLMQNNTDTNIGTMKLQWWRSALNDMYSGSPPPHPMARGLARYMGSTGLGKKRFADMIEARQKMLRMKQPIDMTDLEDYVEDTVSSHIYVNLDILGVSKQKAVDHAASHIGKAIGLCNVIRTASFYASKRRIFFPAALMAQHNVSSEQVFRGETSPGLTDAVFEVASVAHSHLLHARELEKEVDKAAFPAFLPAVMAEVFLERLRLLHFDVFESRVSDHPNLAVQLKLLRNSWLGRY